LYNELITYQHGAHVSVGHYHNGDDGKSFILGLNSGQDVFVVRKSFIVNRFRDKLENFELLEGNNFKGDILVYSINDEPDWTLKMWDNMDWFCGSDHGDVPTRVGLIVTIGCDDESFKNFTTDTITSNKTLLEDYEYKLGEIRDELYGIDRDISNPDPGSPYGQYLAALEKCENDDFSQAQKACDIAKSGYNELNNMISDYDESNNESSEGEGNVPVDTQTGDNIPSPQIIAPQTVLDMLGFISGMKKMTHDYPYIIQGITGLDTAYNKHYGIKDPYLGSGEDKITLTCLESIDLRVSSMFNRYFNAVYDRQYRRERVPINLRRFNCSVYVHDVRHFVTNNRETDNRILELTDMYYSAVEFRFYDCEIVPEETGNIFNDVSNEAPSEMKKTNFTFTYGNCVVNFIPNNIVSENKNVETKSSVSENRTSETNIELYKA
jgi:hypothetical protein